MSCTPDENVFLDLDEVTLDKWTFNGRDTKTLKRFHDSSSGQVFNLAVENVISSDHGKS